MSKGNILVLSRFFRKGLQMIPAIVLFFGLLILPECQLVEQRFQFIGEVWIGCKRLILKLSKVLIVEEVKGPYMHPNQRLNPIQKWYDPRDIQLTLLYYSL